jgi:hypothetical protein
MDGTSESDRRSHCAIVLPDEPRILRVHTLVAVILLCARASQKPFVRKRNARGMRKAVLSKVAGSLFSKQLHAGRMSVSHHVLNFAFRSGRLAKESGPVGDDL